MEFDEKYDCYNVLIGRNVHDFLFKKMSSSIACVCMFLIRFRWEIFPGWPTDSIYFYREKKIHFKTVHTFLFRTKIYFMNKISDGVSFFFYTVGI